MRLAQIARKVNAKPTEIRAFVKKEFNTELDKDPNIKIEDDQVAAILEHFKVEEAIVEPEPEVIEQVVEEIEIDPSIDTDIESLKEVAEVVEEKIEIPEIIEEEIVEEEAVIEAVVEEKVEEPKKKAVGIKHASPEELEALKAKKDDESSEFTAVAVDENAELIAAEIEKLDGLKVVGKIELEDDKETKKLLNEEVELPSIDSVETEIDGLDGEVDTSEFPELGEGESDEDKEAIFAELDAAMESKSAGKVKPVKPSAEISDNTEEDEEDSIFKDARGIYHFSSEQRANRRKSLEEKRSKDLAKAKKEKKARHYKETVAPKVKPKKKKAPSKKAEQKREAEIAKKEAPKGLWGKFLNWIND